jgi:hypothetical protein
MCHLAVADAKIPNVCKGFLPEQSRSAVEMYVDSSRLNELEQDEQKRIVQRSHFSVGESSRGNI